MAHRFALWLGSEAALWLIFAIGFGFLACLVGGAFWLAPRFIAEQNRQAEMHREATARLPAQSHETQTKPSL